MSLLHRWIGAACVAFTLVANAQDAQKRPNILWLVAEDISTHLSFYGDDRAKTPTIDKLAREGVVYDRCWSVAPVCAPARSTLILGMYACSAGSQHMRSQVPMPEGCRMYPALLREAGYFTSNNSKTDYNIKPPDDTWDECGKKAHWRHRKPGQPFFAVFNHEVTHESQLWPKGNGKTRHDPASVRVPPYHPDTPEARRDWAQLYDQLEDLDGQIAARLKELEADGLLEDTIVFFYGDNGTGLPRGKRWLYDLGLHVPLVVHVPEKFKHLAPGLPGTRCDRLVSFVDFGPTVLKLAGAKPLPSMQGRAFLGPDADPAPDVLFGFRDRMDERYDLCRAVSDGRLLYIRNFLPQRAQGLFLNYAYRNPTMQTLAKLHEAGKLDPVADRYFQRKPAEELYDLSADRDCVKNLAGDANRKADLERLRGALRERMLSIRDKGLLHEAEMLGRSAGRSPYSALATKEAYDIERVFAAADAASRLKPDGLTEWCKGFDDPDVAVRYWTAMGCAMLGADAKPAQAALVKALQDPAPLIRVVAAGALCPLGESKAALPVLETALQDANPGVAREAANTLADLGAEGRAILDKAKTGRASTDEYVKRVLSREP